MSSQSKAFKTVVLGVIQVNSHIIYIDIATIT